MALTAPTFRGTYGVMLGAGGLVLSLGLLLPVRRGRDAEAAAAADPHPGDLRRPPRPRPARRPVRRRDRRRVPAACSGRRHDGRHRSVRRAATGTTGAIPPASSRKASDVGITRDAIKLGILIPQDSGSDSGGSFSDVVGHPKEQWGAYLSELNSQGGILGRRVEPVYREYDGLDLDAQRAACVYLTEQAKVFAIVNSGGFYGDPILCVTQQHKTPFIGQAGESLDFYQKSGGRYFSTTPNKDRVLRNLVAAAAADGALQGQDRRHPVARGHRRHPGRPLAHAGARSGSASRVKYEGRISSDESAAQSQIPLEVQQMRVRGRRPDHARRPA